MPISLSLLASNTLYPVERMKGDPAAVRNQGMFKDFLEFRDKVQDQKYKPDDFFQFLEDKYSQS